MSEKPSDLTLLPVFKSTRERLKAHKKYKRETYDEQLNRMIDGEDKNGQS